ncbi:tetratricopeptide repeat protein 27 [Cephus cinctus]|uniref:Tetratricopeptide repeat protein 27 n=1 Tax=Cephus cinctus TaxID=211228 RepID=A0AAJ7FPA1_CEPCN|nr:tetratricopeptide repeat protein 27 [Cephus cinctus]
MDFKDRETEKQLERVLLINYSTSKDDNLPSIVKAILAAEYAQTLNSEFCLEHIKPLVGNKDFKKSILNAIQAESELHFNWLCTGIASILYFVQNNWTGPEVKDDINWLSVIRNNVLQELSLNDQCNENMSKPELLHLAKTIFSSKDLQNVFESSLWWLFRANLLHSTILEELSAVLFDETESLILKIVEQDILQDTFLKTLFHLEATHFYLTYKRIQNSEHYLKIANDVAMLRMELVGAMGKRTKYQQEEKAQLFLKIKVNKELFPSRECKDLPKALELNDDLRLERIEFSESVEKVNLNALEEAIILATHFQIKISLPKDKLTDEEIIPYLTTIIENTRNWSLKMSSLCQRCLLESNHKRTIERSMSQIEYLIEQLNNTQTAYKMDLFFASGMKPIWQYKHMLADLMLNVGMVKGALELYLNLYLWEDVIVCYTILELKHKAAEIIRQQISKKPTVKLWCLLGDATQDTDCYETAWQLSGKKSSRVQRHWGLYYFAMKHYDEAVPHLKQSVELNNIQENVWIRLGFAALQIEDWKLAATAYRRYCELEQTSFEAWNNLAKACIKLGDKSRAWRALQDAVKCNYDRWEIWDNLMVVSIDLGHFSEVIRCYHRILEIKGSHTDVQVLRILTKAVVDDIKDAEGNSSRRLLQRTLELFGHLTSCVPNNSDIWRLYAELSAAKKTELDDQKAAQYLQRAYRCAVSDPRWFQTADGTQSVLDLSLALADDYLSCSRNCTAVQKRAMLGSAKLSLQSVVKKVRDQELINQTEISKSIEEIEERLNEIVKELAIINTMN